MIHIQSSLKCLGKFLEIVNDLICFHRILEALLFNICVVLLLDMRQSSLALIGGALEEIEIGQDYLSDTRLISASRSSHPRYQTLRGHHDTEKSVRDNSLLDTYLKFQAYDDLRFLYKNIRVCPTCIRDIVKLAIVEVVDMIVVTYFNMATRVEMHMQVITWIYCLTQQRWLLLYYLLYFVLFL